VLSASVWLDKDICDAELLKISEPSESL